MYTLIVALSYADDIFMPSHSLLLQGIVVEVPFASFFLSQLVRQHQSLHYSSLDELYSMDPELSRSLQYVKVIKHIIHCM